MSPSAISTLSPTTSISTSTSTSSHTRNKITKNPNNVTTGRKKFSPPSVDISNDVFPYCIVWSPLPPITFLLPFIGHIGIADSHGIIHDFAGPYTINTGRMAFGSPTRYLRIDPIAKCSIIRDNFDFDRLQTKENDLTQDVENELAFGSIGRSESTQLQHFQNDNSMIISSSNNNNSSNSSSSMHNLDRVNELYDNAISKGCRVYSRRMHNICCDNCHSHVCLCLEKMGFELIPKIPIKWNMVYLCFYMFFFGKYTSLWGLAYQWLPFIGIVCLFLFT